MTHRPGTGTGFPLGAAAQCLCLLLCILTVLLDQCQWGGHQGHHPLPKGHCPTSVTTSPAPLAWPSPVKRWQWEGHWAGAEQVMVGTPPKGAETYSGVHLLSHSSSNKIHFKIFFAFIWEALSLTLRTFSGRHWRSMERFWPVRRRQL